MRISKLIPILTMICLAALTALSVAGDPGIPDTVKIEGGPLVVGQSKPISLTIVNDQSIDAYSIGLELTSPDSGFARYDSVVYVNRMADPTVLDFRSESIHDTDGVSPDTLLFGGGPMIGNPLPVGNDPVLLIYFTGLTPTTMTVDSAYVPPAAPLLLVASVDGHMYTYTPQFEGLTITIDPGTPPPVISLPETAPQVVAGTTVEFDIAAESPDNSPVLLDLVSLEGYDDETRAPVNEPDLGAGNPVAFSWVTTAGDVGIWRAIFEACDTSGVCVTKSIDIQVVSSGQFMLAFSLESSPCEPYATVLTHGNFDTDPESEAIAAGYCGREAITFAVYDPASNGQFSQVYGRSDGCPKPGLRTGYLDPDDYLDAIVMSFTQGSYATMVFHGDGDNGFSSIDSIRGGQVNRGGVLGEFTGDNYLDYAVVWDDGVYIYGGDGQGRFWYSTMIPSSYRGMSVNTSDFNGDGTDDIAVGSESGVTIYLQTSPGVFTSSYSYSQVYGSLDIEVTNKGSDFNNDDLYDLCISTPSVGGTHSDMMVYLGQGDGSFDQQMVRTVKGQIFGNCVADFNGDGELDIAYVNGAQKYTAILFGDGDGGFANELRYAIPECSPQFIDCYDIDLDGDVDITVMANEKYDGLLYLLRNELNPGGYSTHAVSIAAHDNAEIKLTSSSGKVFNRVRNTMPSGEYYRRNMETGGKLDDYATAQVVENGAYILSVTPKPDMLTPEPFSAEYFVDGQRFRLAEGASMRSEGYQFQVSLDDASNVSPRSGSFIQANPPSFNWQGSGDFDFQLASDIAFSNVIVNSVVSGNTFVVNSPLPVSDTTIYYWRVKPHGAPAYDCLYAVNLLSGGGPVCGDITGNGYVDVADAVYIINFIFKNGSAPDPYENGDVNGDQDVNVGDAVYYIDYIFRGGPPPACP